MGISDFIKGELIDVIEWTDDSRDTLTHRYPDQDKAIKNGAQLIVRESQRVQFVYLGQFGDQFGPGLHRLTTDNIPALTRLASWKYGFESPFKADVYFLNVRLFTGNKWGTTHPVMMHDNELGVVRVGAFGTYDFHITDSRLFLREVAGSDHDFTLDEFTGTMRSRIVSVFSDALANANVPVLEAAKRYRELGEALLPAINPILTAKYGLALTSFVLENISLPSEVETALDKRSSIAAIGNLNDYVKYQLAQGMEKGGSAAGMATELAVGLAVAQQMMKASGGFAGPERPGSTGPGTPGSTGPETPGSPLPEVLSPADAARALGVSEADVMAAIESGSLPAKKVGSVYRITRAALNAFLAS